MNTDNLQETEWTSCCRKGMNLIDPLAEGGEEGMTVTIHGITGRYRI